MGNETQISVSGRRPATAGEDATDLRREVCPKRSEVGQEGLALSIGYNIAVAVFGGFAPFIATWLIRSTGALTAPSFYVMACAFVSLMVILRLRDRAHEPLQ